MSTDTLPAAPSAPQIDDTQLGGLFQGVDKFDAALPEQARQNLAPVLEHSMDPDGQRTRIANQLFLAKRYNKPVADIADTYEAYRGDYAKKAFGVEEIDDKGFYTQAGGQLKKQAVQTQMLGEMNRALYQHIVSGGSPTDFAAKYLPTIQQNPDFDRAHLDLYYQNVHDQAQVYQTFGEDHHVAVDAVSQFLKSASTELAGNAQKLPDRSALDPLKSEAMKALVGLPPEQQSLIIALASHGVKSPEESGIQKFAGRFTRGVGSMVEGSLDFGKEFGMGPAGFTNYQLDAPERKTERLLRDAFNGRVDPMSSNSVWGKAALGTAESLPAVMASFTPVGLAVNFAAAQNQLQGTFEDKGISGPKAAALATVGGAAQTALQFVSANMIAGKIPGLQGWIAGLTSKVAKLAAVGATETAVLGASSIAQAETPNAVQFIASTMDSTMPKVSKDEFFQTLKDQVSPTALLQLLPLVTVGTGFGSFKNEVFAKKYLTPERLKAAGFQEKTVEKVGEAVTLPAIEQALQQGHAERKFGTPEQRNALADVEGLGEKEGKILPGHIPITIERPDGTRYEASMNGYQDLRELNMGLKESVGRLIDTSKGKQWSHSYLYDGEKIVSPIPTHEEWVSGIRDVSRDPFTSTGDGIETAAETKMMTEWRQSMGLDAAPEESISSPTIEKQADGTFVVTSADGRMVVETSSAEMAGKVAHDYMEQSPAELAGVSLADLPSGQAEGIGSKMAKHEAAMGIVDPASAKVYGWLRDAYRSAGEVTSFLRNVPKLQGFKKIINEWMGGRQMSAIRMVPFLKEVKRIAPERVTREGIANWIDAGGDVQAIEAARDAASSQALKNGYEAALNLKPAELELAKRIHTWFDQQFARAKASGVMGDEDFRNNYVTQMIERPFVGGGVASEFYGKLNQNFQYSEARTFPNFHELEGAGFNVQTKDIGEIMAKYEASLTKAIETRRMVEALMKTTNAQGEPLAYRGKTPEGMETSYAMVDHPSLKGVKFHPDIADHLKNILGTSAISQWYDQPGSPALQLGKRMVKFVDEANRTFANTMLSGISTFHAVHEAKRAAGNRINVFNLSEIKPDDPMVERSVREGLILASPNAALSEFTEGLGGHKSLADHVPGLAQASKLVADFTFNKLIPQIKYTAWLKMRERNLEALKEDIAAGKVTEKDVGYLTAQQVNARFGHLNNADLGKNPTIQHMARMVSLAPDFWESNIRNYGQVLSGLTLSKAGAEPLKAFLLTGMVTWLAARALNSAVNEDHDPHFEEPFGVIHDNRMYTMRSETEDIWRMVKNTRGYILGRLSPTFGSMIEGLTGKNWRGEKESFPDAMRDYLAKIVPLSLRWVPGVSDLVDKISPTEHVKTISLWQQFLGSQGIQVGRKSSISEAYGLANTWKKSVGIKEDTGTYPVSKYQGLRYALEDNDHERLKDEIKKLAPKTAADYKKLVKGAEESLLHPWTGSEKTDETFFQSLSQQDQLKVLTAQFKREAMAGHFVQAIEEDAKEHKIEFTAKFHLPAPSKDPYKGHRGKP